MKALERDNNLLIGALCIIFTITLFWCVKKSDMFIDEIYTYGLSNSYYAPFIEDTTEDGTLINKLFTQADFREYLSVSEGEAFSFDSVYYNQTQDAHPPLYYMILHGVCSLFAGSYSKWLGLTINILFYLITNILLYKVGMLILRSRTAAVLAVLLYATSCEGLSTVLMIRMYILMTLLTVLFLWIVLRLYQGDASKIYYPFVAGVLFLGLFTQYFFVIFAFFISAVFCLHELKEKHMKKCIYYAVSAFSGIGIFYISYPYILKHLFADTLVSGKTVAGNINDPAGMRLSIYSFIMQTAANYKLALLVLLAAVAAGMIFQRKRIRMYAAEFDIRDSSALAMTLAVTLTVIVTAVVSPVTALRYIDNVLPFVALGIVYFAEILWRGKQKYSLLFLGICTVLCCIQGMRTMPLYVKTIPDETHEIIRQHAELPCIYLDDNHNHPITKHMLLLMNFPEVYVTNDFLSTETKMYLEEKDISEGIVLFIDTSKQKSGYDAEAVLQTIADKMGCQYKALDDHSQPIYLLYGM